MNNHHKLSKKTQDLKKVWPPDIEDISMLTSSSRWLSTYGLKALKLDLTQILSNVGFKNSDDYISILKKPVSSRYANGLFKKVAHKNGTFFNIIGSRDNLRKFEVKLQHAVDLYKKRLEWLTTSSRKTFGVVEEKRICIVIDVQEKSETQFQLCMQILATLIKEQLTNIYKFNIIRAASEILKWQQHCISVNVESCEDAISWLLDLTRRTEYSSTSALESILDASKDQQLEAIYLFTDTSLCKSGKDILSEKIKEVKIPLHVVCLDEKHYPNAIFLKGLAKENGGRFHLYPVSRNDLLQQRYSSSSKNVKGFGVRPDVMCIWEELDQARTALFDIQSMMADFDFTRAEKYEEETHKPLENPTKPERCTNEMYMSSKQWLKKHGLKKLNLTLHTFLKGSIFDHCDGVLDTKRSDLDVSVTKSTLINARYCNKFAHINWNDGSMKHVRVTESAYLRFKERIIFMLERYRQRLQWLQNGSRELFGTIVEERVVVLIDTSSSMDSRLTVVKEKLLKLFQEQLVNKEKFNVVHFDSHAEAWKDHLVTCNGQNLDAVWQWVKALQANGSTNTLEALNRGYGMDGVQALYLLTDGRPDQTPTSILSQVDSTIPVHSISFNCDDSEANQFLFDLSTKTGGRYHYFSEDIQTDSESPRPYESEDLFLIRSEIERGLNDLEIMHKLHKECLELDTSNKERAARISARSNGSLISPMTPHKPRPYSAHSYVNNKASLLRMNPVQSPSRNKYFSSIPQENPSENVEKKKKKKKRRSKPSGSEIKRWIHGNGIVAQKLTILDALAPTIINQKAKYVPILGKEVLSKVYGEVLPIIHTTGTEKEYQIVNPQAIDLAWYEERLNECLKVIEAKMDDFIFGHLCDEFIERMGADKTNPPSYVANKQEIDQELELSGLTLVQKDVQLLEKELLQGRIYLKQSSDLREMVDQLSKEAKGNNNRSSSPEKSLSGKATTQNHHNTTNTSRVRYHRVLARSDIDGLYYPALVNKYVNERYVSVCFDNGDSQLTSVRYVVSVGGCAPCPSLSVGDYVLVKSRNGEDELFYVPGIVQVTPLRMKSSSKCYTVIRYNGTKVTALRKDMIKISRSRFVFSTRFIQEVSHSRLADTGAFDGVIHDHKDSGRRSSTSTSSTRSSQSVHSKRSSSSSSISQNGPSIPILIKHSPTPVNDDLSGSSSAEEKGNDSVKDNSDRISNSDSSENEDDADKNSVHSDKSDSESEDKIEALKQSLKEQHSLKMKELEEQKNILIEMQEQLKASEEKQTEKEHLLEKQQQQLLNEQQEFLQKQLKQQSDEQQSLKEKYKDLTEMQLEIFKRQQEQQQQLMEHLLEKQDQHSERQTTLRQVVLKDEQTSTEQISDDIFQITSSQTTPRQHASDIVDESSSNSTLEQMLHDPEVKVFATPGSEALLIGQGDSGLLLSRNPPDQDPAVVVKRIPAVLNLNQEVLARFRDDGWYYRGTLKKILDSNTYVIEDGVGDMEEVVRDDIISDNDDADNVIHVGHHIVALHPRFQYAYAPGMVHAIENDGALKVQFYDMQISVIPRAEAYLISSAKYEHDCAYIRQCEDALIGQAVVSRDNKTGVFYLGAVRERVAGPRNYLIEWADQTLDIQNYAYIFGAHTKRQKFEKDSHVLAIFNSEVFSYLPGVVLDTDGPTLTIQFCNSESIFTVDTNQSFWLSYDYYNDIVKYWKERNPSSM